MQRMKTVLMGAIAILVISASPAMALELDIAPENFYAQGGIIYTPDLKGVGDSSIGVRLGGGFKIDDTFAAELAYIAQGTADEQIGTIATRKWDVSGLMLSGVANYELDDRMKLFARAGFYLTNTDTSTSLGTSGSKTNVNGVLGGGATYRVTDLVDAYAELDLVSDDLTFIAIGARYHFE